MRTYQTSILLGLSFILVSCLEKPQPTLQALEEVPMALAPQLVTVKIKAYRPQSGRIFKHLFVSNFSVKASKGLLTESSARDSLGDTLKKANTEIYGITPSSAYSSNMYFSDLMLFLSGIKLNQQAFLYCPSSRTLSSSNDGLIYGDNRIIPTASTYLGLRDCEKSYLGLDPNKFDFDNDGIPDYLELRCGLNPRNPNDAKLSIAGDGINNLEKCKRNIPIDENANSQPNKLFAYQYVEKRQDNGSTDFTVSNIPILNTGKNNFMAFYLVEIDTTSLQTYLYTAYTVLPAASQNKTFEFNFWGTDPSHYFNQEIVF
ncbi:MAG: hypothetical protein H7333_08130 [Bdellovibrionales bacterium]|nr:hypothetical protein [Oligoflexia bacterium]